MYNSKRIKSVFKSVERWTYNILNFNFISFESVFGKLQQRMQSLKMSLNVEYCYNDTARSVLGKLSGNLEN